MYWNVFIGFYDEEGFKMTQPTEMGIWMGGYPLVLSRSRDIIELNGQGKTTAIFEVTIGPKHGGIDQPKPYRDS